MDREDLAKVRSEHPEIMTAWEEKILLLERDREAAWSDLRRIPVSVTEEEVDRQAEASYRKIHRLDRSIAFLDRALLHLADLERGTRHAADLPLRP